MRFLVLDACNEDRSASSFNNATVAFAPLTPCPYSEPQVSTRVLNLSVITHHRLSLLLLLPLLRLSSNSKAIPGKSERLQQLGIDRQWWIRIRRAGIPKVRKARASPETSVQDSVSRSFLTRLEGCAGPRGDCYAGSRNGRAGV